MSGRVRIGLGIVLLIAAWASLTPALYVRDWAVCRDEVAQVGTKPTVRVCRPIAPTDPPFVVLGIAVVALLVPGISRFAIPGLVEIEREVARQGDRQNQLAREIAEIRVVQAIRQQSVQTVSLGFLPPDADLGTVLERLSEKEAVFRVEPEP